MLTTVPDSTSQKFLILGQIARKDQSGDGRFAVIFLDFAPMRNRKCGDDDFEKWYARGRDHECVMGHKVRQKSLLRLGSMMILMFCF